MYLVEEKKNIPLFFETNGRFEKPDIIWSLINKCSRLYDMQKKSPKQLAYESS